MELGIQAYKKETWKNRATQNFNKVLHIKIFWVGKCIHPSALDKIKSSLLYEGRVKSISEVIQGTRHRIKKLIRY